MFQLTGKVAIVTGASKGIGAAIAQRLAADGAAVVVNYGKSAKEAEAVAARIKAAGGRAIAVQADISKLPDIKALFDKTIAEFGKVDILVNNAGVYDFLPVSNIYEDHFDRQFDLNVKGLLFATQEAVRVFGENGGSIINISSVVSTAPMPNASVYSATKAAVDALTKSLAAELGPKKILVNSVLPGATETEGFTSMPGSDDFSKFIVPQTPLGRLGKPEEIASTVAFLASPDAGWITGQLITVSGGLR